MREELMKLARQMPFVPFTIELSGGQKIPVGSGDHNFRRAAKCSLIVAPGDHGLYDLLPVLHILTAKEPA